MKESRTCWIKLMILFGMVDSCQCRSNFFDWKRSIKHARHNSVNIFARHLNSKCIIIIFFNTWYVFIGIIKVNYLICSYNHEHVSSIKKDSDNTHWVKVTNNLVLKYYLSAKKFFFFFTCKEVYIEIKRSPWLFFFIYHMPA